MPGIEFYSKTTEVAVTSVSSFESEVDLSSGVYYNARLDPKNYLEGPLSTNAATRLRQMLARPGIVVRPSNASRASPVLSYIHQVAPGICDGISARCALEAGFECLYQRLVVSMIDRITPG